MRWLMVKGEEWREQRAERRRDESAECMRWLMVKGEEWREQRAERRRERGRAKEREEIGKSSYEMR
jgi:hypothetical protein